MSTTYSVNGGVMIERFVVTAFLVTTILFGCSADTEELPTATFTAQPSATLTFTPTATLTPTPTITPTLSPTLTPTPAPIFAINLDLLGEVMRITAESMTAGEENLSGRFLSDIEWSPDGSLLAIGGQLVDSTSGRIDNGTWIWDISTQNFVHVLTGHENQIAEISWSPTRGSIATMGWEKTIRLWDLEEDGGVSVLYAYPFWQPLDGMVWSPDGVRIAVGSWDNTIRIINLQTLEILQVGGAITRVRALAWSPDSKYIASGTDDGAIRLWNVFNGNLDLRLRGHSDQVSILAWAPDGNWLASFSWADPIRLWDMNNENTFYEILSKVISVNALDWSPDSSLLAIAGRTSSGETAISFINSKSGEEVGVSVLPLDSIEAISWSPDGMMLAVLGEDVVILAIVP